MRSCERLVGGAVAVETCCLPIEPRRGKAPLFRALLGLVASVDPRTLRMFLCNTMDNDNFSTPTTSTVVNVDATTLGAANTDMAVEGNSLFTPPGGESVATEFLGFNSNSSGTSKAAPGEATETAGNARKPPLSKRAAKRQRRELGKRMENLTLISTKDGGEGPSHTRNPPRGICWFMLDQLQVIQS